MVIGATVDQRLCGVTDSSGLVTRMYALAYLVIRPVRSVRSRCTEEGRMSSVVCKGLIYCHSTLRLGLGRIREGSVATVVGEGV